jgi:ATP-binding cassette, subfamily C, bacteriocin exporter
MLLIIPLYLFIYLIINNVNKRQQRKLMENAADLEAQLVESITAVATIKRFGAEQFSNGKTEIKFVAAPVAGVLTSPPLRKQCIYLSY